MVKKKTIRLFVLTSMLLMLVVPGSVTNGTAQTATDRSADCSDELKSCIDNTGDLMRCFAEFEACEGR